jgi:hypothetical protein
MAVHQHFAGTALADAALHGALAVFQTVVMDRESGLVQRRGDGLAFLAADFLSFKYKFMEILFGDLQNRVGCYLVHKNVFVGKSQQSYEINRIFVQLLSKIP